MNGVNSSRCSVLEYCFENADINENLLLQLNEEKIQSSILVLCFISVIILLGTVGNVLVLATYSKQIHKNSTNFFIFCLATFDLISCVIALPAEMFVLLQPLTYNYPWLCKLHRLVGFSADLASGCTIVCISFDRYLRIARPHKGFSRRTSRRAVISVVFTALIVCSMTLYVYGIETVRIGGHPELQGHRCGTTSDAKETFIPLLFSTTILVAFVIGVFILLTVYIRLGIVVRRWNKGRIKGAGNKRYKKNVGCSDDSSSKCDKKQPKRQLETHLCQIPLLTKDGHINPVKSKSRNDVADVNITTKNVIKSGKETTECSHSDRLNGTIKVKTELKKSPTKETYLTDTEISETDDNSVASLPVIRPGIVKEMSHSLERNGFMVPDPSVHFDGTSTLPRRKISSKQREINKRKVTRKKSLLITDIKKRMTLSKTTTMFIVATVAFVACHVPYVCVKVALVNDPALGETLSATETVLFRLAAYSFIVSYAVNPIIYSFLNSRFRQDCGKLIVTLFKKFSCRFGVA